MCIRDRPRTGLGVTVRPSRITPHLMSSRLIVLLFLRMITSVSWQTGSIRVVISFTGSIRVVISITGSIRVVISFIGRLAAFLVSFHSVTIVTGAC